jgi:aspartyl protease family protein
MVRLAIVIIFCATLLGALMPSAAPSFRDSPRKPLRVESLEEDDRSAQSSEPGSDTVMLERSYDGHFYADARVNGATVHFLIDTGASGIALSTDDARRAGLAFDSGQAEVVGMGASGEVMGHFVQLDRVELGLHSVTDTEAVVLDGGDKSLLGQSFLSKFGSVEIRGDTMVLR